MIRQSTIEEGDILLQKNDNSNWICTKVNTEWAHTQPGMMDKIETYTITLENSDPPVTKKINHIFGYTKIGNIHEEILLKGGQKSKKYKKRKSKKRKSKKRSRRSRRSKK